MTDKLMENMPPEEILYDLADFFKFFADTTRIRILWALSNGELKVNDICECLNMSMSAISHQLRILKQARLVKFRKDGREVYYALNDDHIEKIFELGLNHISE